MNARIFSVFLAVMAIFGGQLFADLPSWEKAELTIGSLSARGDLHLRLPLGQLTGSPEFQLPIYLQHNLREQGTGTVRAVSEWDVPQLQSFAGPHGRRQVLWLEPGGKVHLFAQNDVLKRMPDNVASGWAAVADGGVGNYRFVSSEGWVYTYRQGALISLQAPSGRQLEFTTEHSRILQVRQAGVEEPLLRAEYDRSGTLTALKVGPVEHRFDYNRGQLTAWHSSSRGTEPVRFQYSSRLLSGLRLQDSITRRFEWGRPSWPVSATMSACACRATRPARYWCATTTTSTALG